MSNRQRLPEELAFNATVGSNIKYLRKTRNLNQTKVAAALNVSFQQIQKYEKGMNGICALKLKKLADFFKVGCDVLVDPNMITSHRGFTGNMDWIVGNNQNPKILVGSLKEIKDELVKDGINPEETILPTLRNAAKKEMN
jgi:transcriptional regulator with XRE-family HTH domain